jgi:hypothetical protein
MYVRYKEYAKKSKDTHEKPIFMLEFEGLHAVELSIIRIIQHNFGYSKSDRVNKKLQEIKDILMEEC